MGFSNDNLKSVAEEYGRLKMQKAEIEAAMKKMEPALREALVGKGNVAIGNFTFTVRQVAGRKTLDKKALGEALSGMGLDLESYEKQGAPYTTMSVKETTTLD